MAATFRCSIVTPARSVFDEEVTYASFPAWDGQHGMMAGQSPLLTRLGVGALRLDRPSGDAQWFLIDGGFAQVQDGGLTLLTEGADTIDSLDLGEAEAELAEASARVATAGKDLAKVEHDQRRALAKMWLARSGAQRR